VGDTLSAEILIVDDEHDLANTLEYNLRREGFETSVAHNGEDALSRAVRDPTPDLVLLDLMLPDMSGIEVCRRLREKASTKGIPILMITAKGEEIDRIVGFEMGADDYVTKPFSLREVVLRVKAVLRRAQEQVEQDTQRALVFGKLKVDPEAHRVWLEGEELALTALEFRLLSTFIKRKGRVQTREQLLNDVWGIHADVTTRTVDTHVKRLREKLGPVGEYVETVRGVGYRFRENP
jgi:two-component system phosphate regulon response regulator PhoB